MRFVPTVCIFLLLADLRITNTKKCDQKKRLQLIKRSLKKSMSTLMELLDDEGCELKKQFEEERMSPVKDKIASNPDLPSEKPAKKLPPADKCSDFEPVPNIPFSINCFYSNTDLKNELQIEKLIKSNLCTEILTMVKQEYEDVNGKASFKLLNPADDEPNMAKWRELGLKVFMHIGSWGDPWQLSGQQFSRIVGMPKASERFINAIILQLQQVKFDGLLISWYYPGCLQDDCTTGPLTDEKNLLSLLKRISEAISAKSMKVKVALEISIWPESIYMGYTYLEKIAMYVELMLFENTSPENRVYMKDTNEYKYFSKSFTSFGTLDNAFRNANVAQKKFKIITKKKLMELETITTYVTPTMKNSWRVMNITNKNLCNLVQSAPQISRDMNHKWPVPTINVSTDFFPFNDYDYIKAKVEQYSGPLSFDGVWIRDIWADDVGNDCGCGSFPILRAANEAIGRSACKLPNCPVK